MLLLFLQAPESEQPREYKCPPQFLAYELKQQENSEQTDSIGYVAGVLATTQ